MGGERASSTRQRLAGKTCGICGLMLDAPPWGWHGERLCARCEARSSQHRVLMNFMCRPEGWHISFLEADCRTTLRRKLLFRHERKVHETAVKGGAVFDSETRMMFEKGLHDGRGGIWLNLTDTQYRALK